MPRRAYALTLADDYIQVFIPEVATVTISPADKPDQGIPMYPDAQAVADSVRAIGRSELPHRFIRSNHEIKADGSLVTAADLAMHSRLRESLARDFPRVAFLSEEMPRAEQQQLLRDGKQNLWCIDPLDGTSNFAAGVPYFAVSVALLCNSRPELGVIYDPIRDELFHAQRGGGAWLNGTRICAPAANRPLQHAVAMVDFKRLAAPLAQTLATHPPYGSQRNFGSCALEWCWIAAGRGHVYLHGGQKLWDHAAGSLLLEEAGGHSETLMGEPVFQPALTPRSVVAAADRSLFDAWRAWLATAGQP